MGRGMRKRAGLVSRMRASDGKEAQPLKPDKEGAERSSCAACLGRTGKGVLIGLGVALLFCFGLVGSLALWHPVSAMLLWTVVEALLAGGLFWASGADGPLLDTIEAAVWVVGGLGVMALLTVVLAGKRRRTSRRVLLFGVVVAAIVFVSRANGRVEVSETAVHWQRAVAGVGILALVMTFLSAAEVWLQATDEDREDAERTLLVNHVHGAWKMRTCKQSGVHSIELLRSRSGQPGGAVSWPHDKPGRKPGTTIVMLHGFGVGAGMFAFAMDYLAEEFDNVIALDWYGTGLSHRPTFTPRNNDECEEWFVSALEKWRVNHPLLSDGRKFILLGHSLSGPIVTNYTQKYPEVVEHLVLASPAAVPHPPTQARVRPWYFKIIGFIWSHSSPMTIVRCLGPLGKFIVTKIVHLRVSFMHSSSKIAQIANLHPVIEYQWTNWAGKPSGNLCLSHMLLPGAYARGTPLCDRIVPEDPVFKDMSVSFVYGGKTDWMSYANGEKVVARLAHGRLLNIKFAGHQLYLTQPHGFAQQVAKAHAMHVEGDVYAPPVDGAAAST